LKRESKVLEIVGSEAFRTRPSKKSPHRGIHGLFFVGHKAGSGGESKGVGLRACPLSPCFYSKQPAPGTCYFPGFLGRVDVGLAKVSRPDGRSPARWHHGRFRPLMVCYRPGMDPKFGGQTEERGDGIRSSAKHEPSAGSSPSPWPEPESTIPRDGKPVPGGYSGHVRGGKTTKKHVEDIGTTVLNDPSCNTDQGV